MNRSFGASKRSGSPDKREGSPRAAAERSMKSRNVTRRRRAVAPSSGRQAQDKPPDIPGMVEEGREESGTFAYVAPESWPGLPTFREFSAPADVYSFGVMVVEIVSAKVPFDDVTVDQESSVARYIADGKCRPRMPNRVGKGAIPEKLRDIAAACCQYVPETRPTFRDLIEIIGEEVRHSEYRFQDSAVPFAADEGGTEEKVEEFDVELDHSIAGPMIASPAVSPGFPRGDTVPVSDITGTYHTSAFSGVSADSLPSRRATELAER